MQEPLGLRAFELIVERSTVTEDVNLEASSGFDAKYIDNDIDIDMDIDKPYP